MSCYHLANCDFKEREFEFHYSSNMCVVKEKYFQEKEKMKILEKLENTFGFGKDDEE